MGSFLHNLGLNDQIDVGIYGIHTLTFFAVLSEKKSLNLTDHLSHCSDWTRKLWFRRQYCKNQVRLYYQADHGACLVYKYGVFVTFNGIDINAPSNPDSLMPRLI